MKIAIVLNTVPSYSHDCTLRHKTEGVPGWVAKVTQKTWTLILGEFADKEHSWYDNYLLVFQPFSSASKGKLSVQQEQELGKQDLIIGVVLELIKGVAFKGVHRWNRFCQQHCHFLSASGCKMWKIPFPFLTEIGCGHIIRSSQWNRSRIESVTSHSKHSISRVCLFSLCSLWVKMDWAASLII